MSNREAAKTTKYRKLDLDFARNPDNWPAWPRLPLKRRGSNIFLDPKGLGYLENLSLRGDATPVVFIGVMFENRTDETEKIEYESFEALLEEWEID